MKRGHPVLPAIFLLLAASAARADQVTLVSIRDNTLYENGGGELSNGAGPTMFAGRTLQGSPDIRRALVAFDVAGSIPSGSVITAARLRLFMSATVSGAQSVTLHRVTASWGEGISNAGPSGGMGAISEPGDATWVHRFFDTTTWGSPGGTFVAAASATVPVVGFNFYTWGSTAQTVADVQGWLTSPATNFGWLLRGNESAAGTAKRFDTRENGTVGNRPILIVDYTPPAVPVASATWSRVKALFD